MTTTQAETSEQLLTQHEVEQFWTDGYLLIPAMISRDAAAYYARQVFDLLPRDLTVPETWHAGGGRLKPYQRTPTGELDDCIDTPEFLPLYGNPKLYAIVAQLLESRRLRIYDGSIGITMRASGDDGSRSQNLHVDSSVPVTEDGFLDTLEEVQLGGCYYLTDVRPNGGGIHVVPGGHRRVLAEAKAVSGGRHLHKNWKHLPDMESIEVNGEAGDFALLHHLMPHAASYNRRPEARAAAFFRYVREDQSHGYGTRPARPYNSAQLASIDPLGRRLLGLDSWDD